MGTDKPAQKESLETVTRFEVIDDRDGRILSRWGVGVELSYEDDGRTLKVFLRRRRVLPRELS